jgi:dinuclear metal center YbgI/SA1388 family protein
VVDEAIQKNCELIIAHHPIVFSGLKKFNNSNYVQRVVMKAIKHDIAIYAIHTNYDNVLNGVNSKIAEKLGLERCEILAPKKNMLCKLVTYIPVSAAEKVAQALFDAGAGNIGNYSKTSFSVTGNGTFEGNENSNPTIGEKNKKETVEEIRFETIFPAFLERKIVGALLANHPYEEVAYDIFSIENKWQQVGAGIVGYLPAPMKSIDFLHLLKKTMQTDCVKYTPILKDTIQKIALCGGSGRFLLNDAISCQSDIYITADVKYHEFFDAENHLILADIGHYESEQFTKDLIFEQLSKKFTTFAFLLSEVNTNPVNYL